MICPGCNQSHQVEEVVEPEQLNIRDDVITVEAKFYRCQGCGVEFENTQSEDALALAYRVYREKRGWLQPEQIKKIFDLQEYDIEIFAKKIKIKFERFIQLLDGALQEENEEAKLQMALNTYL